MRYQHIILHTCNVSVLLLSFQQLVFAYYYYYMFSTLACITGK